MNSEFFIASAYFFSCCVLGSEPVQSGLEKIQEYGFEKMPSWYFGFHFMLPFRHHVSDSTVRELQSIFQDIHSPRLPCSSTRQQERYVKVINSLEVQCKKLMKRNVKSPHPFFDIDRSFCETLRPKMMRWFHFFSLVLPNPYVFMMVNLDDTSENLQFEYSLSRIGLAIISSFEDTIKAKLQEEVVSMNAALEVLVDISNWLELKLFTNSIAIHFRMRVQILLTLYLQTALGPLNEKDIGSEVSKCVMISSSQLKKFLDCRYKQRLSFKECATLALDLRNESPLSLIDLVHQLHREQGLFPEYTRFTQKFSRFLSEELINEYDYTLPIAIKAKLKEHIFRKVPSLTLNTSRDSYVAHRLKRSSIILPKIFSDFLTTKHPQYNESFSLHYTFFDTNRLMAKKGKFELSTELLTFDRGNRYSFSTIYSKFIKIIHKKEYFFNSLHHEYENVITAITSFLGELAGYDDFQEILECTMELIELYRNECFLDFNSVPFFREIADVWFNQELHKNMLSE